MGTESIKFENETKRDAQIRENTRKLARHEKLGLVVGGFLLAEGSALAQGVAGLIL